MQTQKGWLIKQTFDNDFVHILEAMYEKYGEEIFSIQGIANKHMDIVAFSKQFFGKSGNVADVSIDGNANVKEKNILQYNYETGKALMKLNSFYLLHKWVKKCFGDEVAAQALEKVVSGELFVNDMNSFHMPYSYYEQTPVIVRVNGKIKAITLRDLYGQYEEHAEHLPDRDTIDATSLTKVIDYYNIPRELRSGKSSRTNRVDDRFSQPVLQRHVVEVMDGDGKWVKVTRILKHKNGRDMILYQTATGDFAFVTDDHPVILEDGSEVKAGCLKVGDRVKETAVSVEPAGTVSVPGDMAYLIGFLLGDGNTSRFKFYRDSGNLTGDDVALKIDTLRNEVYIYQKDIESSSIYATIKRLFPGMPVELVNDRELRFCSHRFRLILAKFFGIEESLSSLRKALPMNIYEWDRDSILSLVAGLVDSDGTVTSNGSVNLRMTAYGLISQLKDVLSSLGIHASRRVCGKEFEWMFGVNFQPSDDLYEKSYKLRALDKKDFNPNMETVERSPEVTKVFVVKADEVKNTFAGDNVLEYVYDITTKSGTFYSTGMLQHNCFAFDLRNLLAYGMNFFKGNMIIRPPRRSESFIALIIQTTAYISNQIMGAASYPDFFVVLDWFYRNEMGPEYTKRIRKGFEDKVAGRDTPEATEWDRVKNQLQNFIYSMNFPFRGSQSAFTNLSVMDDGFMEVLFKDYKLPTADGNFEDPDLKSAKELSKLFFEYFSHINCSEGIFTFPVMTIAISVDKEGKPLDKDFVEWAARANSEKGLANIFQSQPTSFSSCCRLKNDLTKVADTGYQNSFGVGGLSIGSHRVAGLNLPRIALLEKKSPDILEKDLEILHKILYSHRQLIKHLIELGNQPLYTADWIHLTRQYSTIGFIGAHEYVANKDLDITKQEGLKAIRDVLALIEKKIVGWQEAEKDEKNIYNIEQIPGESMCVRLCEIDTLLKHNPNKYTMYSNQYIPLVQDASIFDRIRIQGKIDSHTSGGAILHINVDDNTTLTPKQFGAIMALAREHGCTYFAINYAYSECAKGHYSVGKHEKCPACQEPIVCMYTRVVGFLTPVRSWGKTRREWEFPRRVFYRNGRLEDVHA